MMGWAIESNQLMVMLLLDFEKAYNRVEWGFPERMMVASSFSGKWIAWIEMLYADSWCTVGVHGTTSDVFKLSRSVRQSCPLVPFLYLFVADCLGYLLENTKNVQGIILPWNKDTVTDCEFADDTNMYLVGTRENLTNVKIVLNTFATATGASIN
jgi:hypothetical protein